MKTMFDKIYNTKYQIKADELAEMFPAEYASFLSKCKQHGVSGAVNIYQLSQDLGIIMLWAKKVHRDHPEIRK